MTLKPFPTHKVFSCNVSNMEPPGNHTIKKEALNLLHYGQNRKEQQDVKFTEIYLQDFDYLCYSARLFEWLESYFRKRLLYAVNGAAELRFHF